ncbi:MAG: Mov34/MPN/PAD-1 family protein [Nitrososphaerota archaeon]|nr:Mov34/MPN/PAD-1 family protein [Nitrososphaerota archaeon]
MNLDSCSNIYSVHRSVIDASHDFLHRVGSQGCEGTGLWIGHSISENSIRITRFFAPEQICTKTQFGISVDLTPCAHLLLTDNLRPGELFYARIHSHPARAYHSQKDDANPILTHEGAISIVVPNFAQQPIDLGRCAIYRLEHGRGWLSLSAAEILSTFTIIQ